MIEHPHHPIQSRPRFAPWLPVHAMATIGIVSALLGVLYLMYHFFGVTDVGYDIHDTTRSAFRWIFHRWQVDWNATKYAHSQWIPLISLVLIWLDRRALAALPKRINYLGLLVIVGGLALHWAGVKSQQTRLTIMSMVVLSWGVPFFACGWPVARRLIFPCGFLVFCLPLNFFDAAAYPLRLISAAITSGIASGLGLDISRSGAIIISNSVDGYGTNLADSHTSIFAVTAAIAFAALCAHLMKTPWRWRLLVVALGIPLLVLSTILRGILILLSVEALGIEAGRAIYQHASGPITCLVTFGGLMVSSFVLQKKFGKPSPKISTAEKSSPSTNKALVIALGIMTAAAWWIPGNLHIEHLEEAGVNVELPQSIGEWHGGMVLFCHKHEETGDIRNSGLQPGDPCPTCGAPLFEMSQIERALLPPDTLVRKNRYEHESGNHVYLSIVLSGKYRSSIHRPEVCLVGPDSQIAHSFTHPVKLDDGRILNVKVLEMIYQYKSADGKPFSATTYYAYWFAGIDRETPSHLTRMAWMASDRLFKNQSYRWAYISLGGRRIYGNNDYLGEIDAFLRAAYPYLKVNRPDASVVGD
jgi:exosortase